MATPWDRIEEAYRAYLLRVGYSAAEFNDHSFNRAVAFNAFEANKQQQQANGEKCCRFGWFALFIVLR